MTLGRGRLSHIAQPVYMVMVNYDSRSFMRIASYPSPVMSQYTPVVRGLTTGRGICVAGKANEYKSMVKLTVAS